MSSRERSTARAGLRQKALPPTYNEVDGTTIDHAVEIKGHSEEDTEEKDEVKKLKEENALE